MYKLFIKIVFLFLIIFIYGCDKGIEPYPEPVNPGNTGMSGTITFTGSWPDSIQQTRLIIFKNRIQTVDDFFPPNLSYFTDNIPFGTEIYEYKIVNDSTSVFTLEPGTYNYIVVAQSIKTDLSLARKDWLVAGVYYADDSGQPGSVTVAEGKLTENINITCDFDNPPPQPPGGS